MSCEINVFHNAVHCNDYVLSQKLKASPSWNVFLFSDGKVSFVKVYAGHTVCYEGETKGVQMTGQWWLDTHPECRGDWAMWPATVQSAETY